MSVAIALRAKLGAFELDVQFAMERAGVTALYGPSGSGKTTVVNAVAGLFRPKEAHIAINGRTLLDTGRDIDVPIRKRRVGYVFQDARLFPHMTVRDNLLFGWRRAEKPPATCEIDDVIDLLALRPLLTRGPGQLSGGEKQRLALGRALLSAPELLLLDEPMASLDRARRDEILPYLERLRDEARLPMLYVSHSVDEVARLADEIVVLEGGHVLMHGSVFDVMPQIDRATGAVLPATVKAHRDDGLSELEFDGGKLLVQHVRAGVGTKLRVRIAAQDIMLAREEPRQISANNVIAATVSEVRDEGGALANVRLACGRTRLFARITTSSATRLALAAGMPVFAIIKAVTVDAQTSAMKE